MMTNSLFPKLTGAGRKRLKWIAIGLLLANEVRGIIVVAAVGPPIFKALFG